MRFCNSLITCGLLFTLPLANGATHAWRELGNDGGAKIQARFEGLTKEGKYLLRRKADAKLFEVAPGMLAANDRAFFDAAAETLTSELARINAAADHVMFTGTPFEARDASGLAAAMKLPSESISKFTKSWRRYVSGKGDYKLFGTHPYSVALYADGDNHVTSLSVIYANKGDFGSSRGSGQAHFEGGTTTSLEELNTAMQKDVDTISAALSSVLGEPQTQRYGEGKTRRLIKRWDWNGHSMLLSHEENEYVSLLITPLEVADAGGKTARLKDIDLRARMKTTVVRNDFGDVYISEIPMVDQGPKGYCVPATFERAMRFMGIDADMYMLAMIGEAAMGGGTSVEKLMENVRRQVYSKGRRTKDEKEPELRYKDLKKYLDDGVPIMWTMKAMDEYGNIARSNTSERKNADVAKWSEKVAAQNAEFAKKPKADDGKRAHMCMIIGYNEKTQELAVSDSWGPEHALKWVPLKVADWASSGGLFMILP